MENSASTLSTSEIPKIWKTSITKTELAELPAEILTGGVTVVDSTEAVEPAVEKLTSASVIGFDTETKPSFKRGERHSVALLQLSTPEESFLFRLNKIGLPESVVKVLEDAQLLKIGLSIRDDFHNLQKRFNVHPQGFIDLQEYVKEYNIADNSLTRIYGILFDKRISKGQRLSNWEAPELSQHQQEYAALDAKACITIYEYLRSGCFDYRNSKYYREFEDPALAQNSGQKKDEKK